MNYFIFIQRLVITLHHNSCFLCSISLDLELIPKKNRLDIGKYNGRIPHGLKPREPTFQVVLDAIALTPCNSAFLITADVPEICPRVSGKDFDALPSEEDTVSFLRELGHIGEINSLNDVVIDQMHQPCRTFDALINRGLSGKTSGFDKLRLSRAQILWGGVPPKIARKFKKSSTSKKDSDLVPVDEEPLTKGKRIKRSVKKYSTKPATGIVIRELLIETKSKIKEKVRKKRLRDFYKLHPSGSGTVAEKPPRVDKITLPVTSEGTDDKPGDLDVTKDESTESESEFEIEYDDDEVKDDIEDDNDDDDDKFEGDEDRGMDSNDFQNKKVDVEMTDAQQEKENLKITQEQVVEDAHVTIITVAKETKVPDASGSHSSDLASKFLNLQIFLLMIVIALEKDVAEMKKDPLHTQLTTLVDDHLDTRMGATRKEFMNFLSASLTDRIKKQVKNQLPQILPKEVSNFAPPVIEMMITESLNQVNLTKVSSQPQSAYEAADTLTEFELKKILIDKINSSESYLTALEHRECYDGLINSYNLDKDFFSSYDVYSLKRSRQDKDKDEGPSVGLDRGNQSSRLEILTRLKVKKGIRVMMMLNPGKNKTPQKGPTQNWLMTLAASTSTDKLLKEFDKLMSECSSCGALYTMDYCCSDESLMDKIICDLNKTPDLSQRPPQNCPMCGNLVDVHYCQGCALLRKKFKEDLFTYCIENGIFQDFQDTSKPSNDNTNFLVIHQPIREKTCAELLAEERATNINSQPFQYSIVYQPPQEEISVLSLAWETILEIEHALEDKHCQPEDILESFQRLHNDVQNIHEELALYINTSSWDRPTICYNDDDDEDCTIIVTPILSTEEPDNSLSMRDEHLDAVSATESDEVIKSSVENLVSIPSESEGIPDNMYNPTPYSDFITKSSSTSLNFLLEETNTFDNSLPKSKTFYFDLEENSSGSTTTRTDISLPDYEAFYDDLVKEISSGSTTTHSDSSLYDSFIFDLLINPFPPADKSDFYEFVDELAHIISPPEYDCFSFKNEPNLGDFTMDVIEDTFPIREPRVHVPNVLPTHPTLQLNMDFILSSESLFAYVALSEKLDWDNPEGGDYPFDLSKPLLLITRGNRESVPVEFFINNDLKYIQGGISTMTYTTSTTKTKATQYDLPGIEDMRAQHKSFYAYARGKQSKGDFYSTKRILAVTHVSVMRKHGYGYLKEIVVRRADNALYKFKEGDDVADFAIALIMFTRSLVIQKHYQEYQHEVLSKEKMEQIGKEKSSFHDQGHQLDAKGNEDDEEFREICWW
nr:hypothetical protein [Tanacetum cinerariifolium]